MKRKLSVLLSATALTLIVNDPVAYAAGQPELTKKEKRYIKRTAKKIAKKQAQKKINAILPLAPDDLAPGAVNTEKTGNEAVIATKIENGAVGESEIADGAVTESKLSAELLSGRKYYLTQTEHQGGLALSACGVGFHMASKWEIRNTSHMSYDTTNGYNADDGGFGPPSDGELGWVRTGFESDTGATAGRANCAVWTSFTVFPDDDDKGTWAALGSSGWDWLALGTSTCDTSLKVWCIQD